MDSGRRKGWLPVMALRSRAVRGRGAIVPTENLPLQSFPLERVARDIHREAVWHEGWDVAAVKMHHCKNCDC